MCAIDHTGNVCENRSHRFQQGMTKTDGENDIEIRGVIILLLRRLAESGATHLFYLSYTGKEMSRNILPALELMLFVTIDKYFFNDGIADMRI